MTNIDLSHEKVARRAYEIYERSGRLPGRDVENWLRAEAELQREIWLQQVTVPTEVKAGRLKHAPAFPGVAKPSLRNRRNGISQKAKCNELNRTLASMH